MQAVFDSQKWLIMDTETTGLDGNAEIIQIAIVDAKRNCVINSLVKPSNGIPPEATEIHGITDDDVADAPAWEEVQRHVSKVLCGHDIIVYNAVFDRRMLYQTNQRHGLERVDWKQTGDWHCLMEQYSERHGDWSDYHQSYKWVRLEEAAHHQKIKVENAHTALGDCLMTYDLFYKMYGPNGIPFSDIDPEE